MVDGRQRVLEFDPVAGHVTQLLGHVVSVMADEFGDRRERLRSVAEKTVTLAVIVDLHVRHRIAYPAHAPDARCVKPTDTFPDAQRHRQSTGTKLHCWL